MAEYLPLPLVEEPPVSPPPLKMPVPSSPPLLLPPLRPAHFPLLYARSEKKVTNAVTRTANATMADTTPTEPPPPPLLSVPGVVQLLQGGHKGGMIGGLPVVVQPKAATGRG